MSAAANSSRPDLATRLVWGTASLVVHTASIVALLVAWELFARSGKVTMFMLPPFSAVAERIWADAIDGKLWMDIGLTLYRTFVGFALACIIGIGLGTAMARTRLARWFFDPIISIGFPMPKVVFLPVVILWRGVFDVSKITMVTIEAIFPVVTATVLGIQGVGHELIWSARCMGAGRLRMMWDVVVPSALPELLNGIRTALALAFILMVTSELIVAREGLGNLIGFLGANGSYAAMYAVVLTVAFMGFAADRVYQLAAQRVLAWRDTELA